MACHGVNTPDRHLSHGLQAHRAARMPHVTQARRVGMAADLKPETLSCDVTAAPSPGLLSVLLSGLQGMRASPGCCHERARKERPLGLHAGPEALLTCACTASPPGVEVPTFFGRAPAHPCHAQQGCPGFAWPHTTDLHPPLGPTAALLRTLEEPSDQDLNRSSLQNVLVLIDTGRKGP
eukprot:355508-Chlamydomonas_euryale.AAC.2